MKPLRTYLFFLFFLLSKLLQSQETNIDTIPSRPMNSFNINLGDASGISLNYERLFKMGQNFLLAGKIGLGYNEEFKFGCTSNSCQSKYLTVPASITMNFGKKRNFFEVGMGGTKLYGDLEKDYWLYPLLGYRFQPLIGGKFNFRIYYCVPLGGYLVKDIFFNPSGLSTGVLF
ncbi:MAG: hypothetical protein KBG70_11125 [Chitinophagales bacterium]|nr:hypothetical protein [Chitinophagales bacterium]